MTGILLRRGTPQRRMLAVYKGDDCQPYTMTFVRGPCHIVVVHVSGQSLATFRPTFTAWNLDLLYELTT